MQINNSRTSDQGLIRIRSSCVLLCITLLAGPTCYSDPTEDPPLVRVSSNSEGPFVGELLKEDETTLELFDFHSNRNVSLSKTSVTDIEKPITLDDAAGYVGLPAVMGRKISVLSRRQIPTGKIAKVGPQIVYLTLGESSGVTVGQKVSVFRGEEDILDPDTGIVLASERARIAELVISEVNQHVSKARLTGDLEISLEVGDEVEPEGVKLIVAVCPLSNENGSANPIGNSIAEELVGALVQRKVSVVERSVLDRGLAELLAQNTILFDQKSAQTLGKLTGASMVLTGKIIQEKSTGTAHVRLIDVQTGTILQAVSAPVKFTSPSSTAASTMGKQRDTPGSSVESDVPQPGGELEQLGKTRSLPKFLTTASALQRPSEGGVRFQGQKKHEEYAGGIILTRERDFLERNFIFEVLVRFGPDDGIANIGIGTGRKDGSANRRADSLFMRFHAPHHGDGEVQVQGWETATVNMGRVRQNGVHLVRMTKRVDSLTFEVDPENDGPSEDDMELVIPNLREHAPYLNSKNCNLFLSGTATFVATRLEILNGDVQAEQPEGHELPAGKPKDALNRDSSPSTTVQAVPFVPLIRFFHLENFDHCYSHNEDELAEWRKQKVWKEQEVLGRVAVRPERGTVRLARWTSTSGRHFYTVGLQSPANGLSVDHLRFSVYVWKTPGDGRVPVYGSTWVDKNDAFFDLQKENVDAYAANTKIALGVTRLSLGNSPVFWIYPEADAETP